MPQTNTASCLCGAVRMVCGDPAGPGSYCHCVDCRKSTGGAFGVAIPFHADQFSVLGGRIGSFTKQADSGNDLTRNFCLDCGSPVFGTSPQHPGLIYVKAGMLDDQSLVQPTHQSWCRSKVAWAEIDAGLPMHPKGKTQRKSQEIRYRENLP